MSTLGFQEYQSEAFHHLHDGHVHLYKRKMSLFSRVDFYRSYISLQYLEVGQGPGHVYELYI